jgi:hypothetical protein
LYQQPLYYYLENNLIAAQAPGIQWSEGLEKNRGYIEKVGGRSAIELGRVVLMLCDSKALRGCPQVRKDENLDAAETYGELKSLLVMSQLRHKLVCSDDRWTGMLLVPCVYGAATNFHRIKNLPAKFRQMVPITAFFIGALAMYTRWDVDPRYPELARRFEIFEKFGFDHSHCSFACDLIH